MKKEIKITLLIIPIILVAFSLERFVVIIDTSYDPYSEYASTKKEERGELLDYEFIKTITSDEINGLFPETDENEGDISNLPEYDIDLYRINYTSIFLYDIVTLSGLIIVPQKTGPLSHMQYHHGTLYPYADNLYGESLLDAPSLYDGNYPDRQYAQYESRLFGNFLGSYGYLVSLPDYIGYGVSEDYEHTYSVNDRLAEQSVDMIIATQAFCTDQSIDLNDKLFLSGWSEGGAAALATQKLIESDYEGQISVTANAPLASFSRPRFFGQLLLPLAPFDFTDWGTDLHQLLWATYAINRYTDDKPLDTAYIFKFEVENQFDVLRDRPTNRPSQSIRYFIKGKSKLMSKYAQNDLSGGWAPQAPIYIHHGTDDTEVFYYFNAEPTVRNLNKLGGDVELVKYPGHDHYTLDKLYLLNMIDEFGQY